VNRILTVWTDCRARAGSLTGDDAGPFLFGRFSIADAMFAPICWRFRSFDVELSGAARQWYETMLALPAMQEWERDALAEVNAAAELAPG
jgi:glutathione S-transferase